MKTKYCFTKFESIYDANIILYGLSEDGFERTIDGIKFLEVTPDFDRIQNVRADSLKPIGFVVREY